MKLFTTLNQAYSTLSFQLRNSLSWITTLDLHVVEKHLENGDRAAVADMILASMTNMCRGQKQDVIVKAVYVYPVCNEQLIRGSRVITDKTLVVKVRFDLVVSSNNPENAGLRHLIITDQVSFRTNADSVLRLFINPATYKDVIRRSSKERGPRIRADLLMDLYRHQIAHLFHSDQIAASTNDFQCTDPLVGTAIYQLTKAAERLPESHNINAVFFKDVKAIRVDDHVLIDAMMEYRVGKYNVTYALPIHLAYSSFEMSH